MGNSVCSLFDLWKDGEDRVPMMLPYSCLILHTVGSSTENKMFFFGFLLNI